MDASDRRSSLLALLACVVACAGPPRPRVVVPLQAERVGAVEAFGPGLVATDDSGATITFANVAPASIVIVRVWPGSRLEPLYPARNRDSTSFPAGMHTVAVARPEPWMAWPSLTGAPFGATTGTEEERASRCFWNRLRRQVPPLPARGDTARARQTLAQRFASVDLAAIEEACQEAVRRGFRMAPADAAPPETGGYFLIMVAGDVPQDARRLRAKLAGTDITASDAMTVLQSLPALLAGSESRRWAAYVAFVP